jgi:hypothetical protein
MPQTVGQAGSMFQCDYHGVKVSPIDPSWDEQIHPSFTNTAVLSRRERSRTQIRIQNLFGARG